MEFSVKKLPSQRELPLSGSEAYDAKGGWDPYEVWRTRVLLPRLGVTEKAEVEKPRPVSVPNAA